MNEMLIVSAIVIGLSLGIFGSGGAILTLPTLIYLLQLEEKVAIVGSLIIVGTIALFTLLPHLKSKSISNKHLIYFALPGLVSSYVGAYLGGLVSPLLQLVVFVVLMVVASVRMLIKSNQSLSSEIIKPTLLSVAGLVVGFATGFVGVGGGFLIVPALMFLGKLNIAKATATSIAIIVLQSTVGAISYYQHSSDVFAQLPWPLLFTISGIGIVGSYAGVWLKQFLKQEVLSKFFGYFLLLMAISIFADRVIF